jgi:hypothetical protein
MRSLALPEPNQAQLAIYTVAVIVIFAILVGTVAARSRRQLSGYRFGADVVVRCRDGHLFTTTWIPGVSIKSIRLGLVRYQYCPVGQHMTLVELMKDSDLTPAERLEAQRFHDGGLP